jgi:hypothetical protein
MDIGSILIGLALLIVVGAYLGQPLIVKGGRKVTSEDRQLSELQAQRDRILNRLQELDMDFAMGKVLEPDYQQERSLLMQTGAETLKAIDGLTGGTPVRADQADDDIEAAVARLRGKDRQSMGGFCPACGAEVQDGDAFCTRCGQTLDVLVGTN